jgi:hypothetical protein
MATERAENCANIVADLLGEGGREIPLGRNLLRLHSPGPSGIVTFEPGGTISSTCQDASPMVRILSARGSEDKSKIQICLLRNPL